MHTIEIDFDVFKALTLRRDTEDISYNDVLRELLGLGRAKKAPEKAAGVQEGGRPWVSKNVSFPHGTEFRSKYKGREYRGTIDNGFLVVNGRRFVSPSAAAISITNNPVNGWIFWECKMPGETRWKTIKSLRNN